MMYGRLAYVRLVASAFANDILHFRGRIGLRDCSLPRQPSRAKPRQILIRLVCLWDIVNGSGACWHFPKNPVIVAAFRLGLRVEGRDQVINRSFVAHKSWHLNKEFVHAHAAD